LVAVDSTDGSYVSKLLKLTHKDEPGDPYKVATAGLVMDGSDKIFMVFTQGA